MIIYSLKNIMKILVLLLVSVASFAKVDSVQQVQLKNNLTPFGAIKAGNGKDIPEWNDVYDNLADEKPLLTITHENYQQYKENLTAGQTALFERYETYQMPVYSSHRTAVAPQWVYDNTFDNAITTELNKDHSGYENVKGGIPFPMPQSALEVYFNHIARWRGQQVESMFSDAVVEKSGQYTLITNKALVRFDSYLQDHESKSFISVIGKTLAPATRSGSGVLVLEPLDQLNNSRSAWLWDKGRRRVIRAPNVSYDNVVQTSGGLRTVDDTDMISGSPDRYDWKMLEKCELYIPYNNEKLDSKELRYRDILTKNHINPNYTRYELHRVWVIQAELKPKWRHLYSKRTFYIDEDTWQVVLADQYNKKGDLWRVSMAYPKFFKEMPGVFSVINVFHDLMTKRYHVMGLENEVKSEAKYNGEIAKDSLFTPSGFKRYMR
jgi:hypothetical protein